MGQEVKFKGATFDFPIGVKIVNYLFKSYASKPLDVSSLLDKAKKSTGLTDFGDDFFLEPLNILVDEINKNTKFHALGRFLYKKKIQANLSNRLWAIYWVNQDPSIQKELPPALLITGLQRTGTTFLQRMLGNLPEFRGVISWEIVNPVPRSKKKNYYGKHLAKIFHILLNYINPEFKSIHSVRHDSLEEEVVLLDHAFMSTATQAALNVPNFSAWLEKVDQTNGYKDLKMWLQLLLWRKPAKNFLLLKSPHHMEFLDAFIAVFPNTRIVQTHRSPVNTLASYCSMVHFGKKIFSPSSNPEKVGEYWLRKDKRLVQHCMDFREKNPDLFYDVAYNDLVKNPIEVAKKIYSNLNLEWKPSYDSITEAFCQEHKKNKYGKHIYSLEDFGLTKQKVEDTFSDYMETYKAYL